MSEEEKTTDNVDNVDDIDKTKLHDKMRERIANESKLQEDSINTAVMMLRVKDPKRYEKAQYIGSSYMDRSYNLEVGFDNEGSEIRAKELLKTLNNGLITKDDLTTEEVVLLNRFYDNNW
jgi:hypothetical protein